jgi:ABC-type antimicrobial peptide transport system permease subunit
MGAWFSGTVSLLALVALIIAATGIYGMLSYLVVERTNEIGIRRPGFACHSAPERHNVLLLIVSDGMKLAGAGIVIGVAVAIVLTKVMSTLLFGVGPIEAPTVTSTDAFTFATVSIGTLAVVLLACYLPARRATKVDPLVALRNE